MSDPFPFVDPVTVDSTPAPEHGRPPWRLRDLVFSVIGGLVLSLVVGFVWGFVVGVARRDAELAYSVSGAGVLGILIYAAMALSGWFFAVKRRGATLRDAGFRPVSAGTLLKMVPMTIGLLILNLIVVAISSAIFGDVPTAQDQVVGNATSITFGEFMWLLALGAVAAPVVEEFFFRGLLYPLMRARVKVVGAVMLSSLIFAATHFIPPLIPVLLVMGIVLAYLYQRYDSIYPAIAVHALNNAFALTALYATIGR